MPKENVELIADHYQKTFELTHEIWKERNRLFVFLVLTTGIGLLLLLQVPEANSLLVDAVVKLLGITDQDRVEQLYKDFPLDVILSIILIIVFYLMQKLYSTNLGVFRNYFYLGAVENEIREGLNLNPKSVSFTREGSFYWDQRSWTQRMSKWYFILVILIALLSFITLKVISDFKSCNYLITSVDIIVSIITLLYFVAYASSALDLDVEKIPPTPKESSKEIPSTSK